MSAPDELLAARARAGAAIRTIGHAFIGRHATIEQVERLTDALTGISAELWPAEPRSRADHPQAGQGPRDYPQGRFEANFDDRPFSGRSSPWGLDPELHRYGDEIEARVTLRSAHEGAPGRSHGGIVAGLFDDVFGYLLGIIHQPAFTGELTVRYVAPTPLHRELACRARIEGRTGRRIVVTGTLRDVADDSVVATSQATFIAVDPQTFERLVLSAERPAPPDEGP